ncbi:MAG: hypothetical protein AAF125_13190, partial [Chloroflexota bacterium]
DVIDAIRKLAVRDENIMVARVTLHNLRQDRDEPIRNFAARLRGQASICKYTLDCPRCDATVDYSDQVLRDAITRGILDSDIQLDLLGEQNQDMTLEQTVKYIEAKESGKRSAHSLQQNFSSTAAATSSYRKSQRKPPARHEQHVCKYCGRTEDHGMRRHEREKSCPAFSHTCGKCNIRGHFDAVCRGGRKSKPPHTTGTAAAFDSLCTIVEQSNLPGSSTNHGANAPDSLHTIAERNLYLPSPDANCGINAHGQRVLTLDHHVYNDLCDTWIRRSSDPQPYVDITIKGLPSDFVALGFRLDQSTLSVPYRAIADTGCQSCLAGEKLLKHLRLRTSHLIPVSMRMQAANDLRINILGALILRLSGQTDRGKTLTTRQIVYFTDNSDRFYLNKQACIALGLITPNFPTIGETNSLTITSTISEKKSSTNSTESSLTADCKCPRRTAPPKVPTSLPFPATTENRAKLQNYLLEYYRSSTFNVCEHQPLPMMQGPPLRMMINEGTQPVAYHTPIPVPLHWTEDVKAGLDQDVRLGVIEPVPIGTPVTWCHRMVIW